MWSRDQWISTVSGIRQLLTEHRGRWSRSMVDLLKLHINTVGCQINDLKTKRSPQSLGYSPCVRGRRCATFKSSLHGKSDRQVFPCFLQWSNIDFNENNFNEQFGWDKENFQIQKFGQEYSIETDQLKSRPRLLCSWTKFKYHL